MPNAVGGIKLERNYYLLDEGGARRKRFGPEDVISAGSLIGVELQLSATAEREFVHLLDPCPAGFEPVDQISGYHRGSWWSHAYKEVRGTETNFYIRTLYQGTDTFTYHVRAITAGKSLALPARAECMYSPDEVATTAPRTILVD